MKDIWSWGMEHLDALNLVIVKAGNTILDLVVLYCSIFIFQLWLFGLSFGLSLYNMIEQELSFANTDGWSVRFILNNITHEPSTLAGTSGLRDGYPVFDFNLNITTVCSAVNLVFDGM